MLLEISLFKLIQNTVDEFGAPRDKDAKGIQIKSITFVPYQKDRILHVKSEVGDYDTEIRFNDVKYVSEDSSGPKVKIDDNSSGEPIWIEPINERRSDVQVKCTCLDFYYRFAPFNAANNALIGDPPPRYVKKTDRPPVNPNEIPGVCKHIIRLHDELRKRGIIK